MSNTNALGKPVIPGLSSDQVQRLVSLIDAPWPGFEQLSGKNLWLLDSRALCHMVGDMSLLREIKKIPHMGIGLPNKVYTMASEKESITLGNELQSKNVLYVPNLKCNLI